MKKQDKELLLKDLCARLPYGVICSCLDNSFTPPTMDYELVSVNLQDETVIVSDNVWNEEFKIKNIKPYLRPMSDMTDEELNKLQGLCIAYDSLYPLQHFTDVAKFLYEHLIDFDNLIEKDIALPAPDGMYNF